MELLGKKEKKKPPFMENIDYESVVLCLQSYPGKILGSCSVELVRILNYLLIITYPIFN